MARPTKTRLTPAELAVIELMADGLSENEIARRLGTTPNNVWMTARRVYIFCGALSKREQAIRWWRAQGRKMHGE